MYHDVSRIQVAPSHATALATASVTVSGHRHLDDVRREFRERVTPRRRQPARSGVLAVAPHGGADAGGVGERTVVDEVHAPTAADPFAGPQSAPNGFVTQARVSGLSECDDPVLATQIVLQQHVLMDVGGVPAVPPAISARLPSLSVDYRAEIALK
jgi:hypothetical protein